MGNSAFKAHNFTVNAVTTSKTNTNNENQVYIPSYHGNFDNNKVGSKSKDFKYPFARNTTGKEIGSGVVVWILFEGGDVRCPIIINNTGTKVKSSDFPGLNITDSGVGGPVDVTGTSADSVLLSSNSLYGLIREMLLSFESGGDYSVVVPNDNGALSIGLIGFHGRNAQTLLQKIKEQYKSDWDSNGGENIANLYGGEDWDQKILDKNSAEFKAIQKIISSPGGKKVQDEMVNEFIDKEYIKPARSLGVTEGPALVYYCDMAVQTPRGAEEIVRNASKKDLDGLYKETMAKDYWLSTAPGCAKRRTDCYNKIKKWIKEGKFNADPYGISDESKPFIWPVPYAGTSISSAFGWRTVNGVQNKHYGIDICVPGGENYDKSVIATAAGTVVAMNSACTHNDRKNFATYQAQSDCAGGWGNYIAIKHDQNLVSIYGHLITVGVKLNEKVQGGQIIGVLGCTGCSTGPHLHFQINKNGDTSGHTENAVNPEDYVGRKK